MSVIETLTEGIRQRSLANEGEALLGKWEKTGLLWHQEMLKDLPQLHSQSFAVYSAIFWPRTSCPSNQ